MPHQHKNAHHNGTHHQHKTPHKRQTQSPTDLPHLVQNLLSTMQESDPNHLPFQTPPKRQTKHPSKEAQVVAKRRKQDSPAIPSPSKEPNATGA
jgi:acyl-CoA thioesterase